MKDTLLYLLWILMVTFIWTGLINLYKSPYGIIMMLIGTIIGFIIAIFGIRDI